MRSADDWKIALRAALRDALRAKQPHAVTVIRETLGAIENAEAADLSAAPAVQEGLIAGGVKGLGAGDVPRRVLTAEDVTALIARELQERQDSANMYVQLSRHDEANALKVQIEMLVTLLSQAK